MQSKNLTKGYLVVASRKKRFYTLAVNLLNSIKDFYPEAKCCLVTEERFLDESSSVADDIIICTDHYRAKLWGMSKTPYDITFYMDADMDCVHEDIKNVFDELGDNDLVFTGLPRDRWYIFKDTEFTGGTFKLCGAVCLYRSHIPLVREFIEDWFYYYDLQKKKEWWPLDKNGLFDEINYPRHLRIWDQFTLWWLSEKDEKYKDLKINVFDNDLRWNYWSNLQRERHNLSMDEVVLFHFSASVDKGDNDFLFIDY